MFEKYFYANEYRGREETISLMKTKNFTLNRNFVRKNKHLLKSPTFCQIYYDKEANQIALTFHAKKAPGRVKVTKTGPGYLRANATNFFEDAGIDHTETRVFVPTKTKIDGQTAFVIDLHKPIRIGRKVL